MAGRVQHHQRAVRDRVPHVLPDGDGCYRVVGALQDQRRRRDPGQLGPVVRQEGHPGERTRDRGVGAAEALGELRAQLGTVGVAHDHRGHRARPAQVVAVQRVEELLDVLGGEPADVRPVVDVARRRADEDQLGEEARRGEVGEHADHRGDRVPDEDHVPQVELGADVEHVVGVALQGGVAHGVVRREVRAAAAHVVEADHAEVVLERGGDEAPHVLVAAESVGEDHGPAVGPSGLAHVAAGHCLHGRTLSGGRATPTGEIAPKVWSSGTGQATLSGGASRSWTPVLQQRWRTCSSRSRSGPTVAGTW